MIGELEQDKKHLVVKGALNVIINAFNLFKFSLKKVNSMPNTSPLPLQEWWKIVLMEHHRLLPQVTYTNIFLNETNIFVSFAVRMQVKCWYLLHLVDTVLHSPHHCYSSTITHVHRQSGSGKS